MKSRRYLSNSDKWRKQRRHELMFGLACVGVFLCGLLGLIVFLAIKIVEKI